MQLVLVGADHEENLGLCMIAAAAEEAGHRTAVVPFQDRQGGAEAVRRILALRPDVIGLAMQFQHRGLDYLTLACELRRAGFRGHITAGGQFATMAATAILSGRYGIDSVALYEGEGTIGDLLAALAAGRALTEVAGLTLPDHGGGVLRTAPRPLAVALDALPLAHRYRQHSRQFGVPFIPVSGSRGCWAACSFCSITSVLRDGREHGVGGRRLRLRSPEDVGLEMAMLAQAVGGSAVFCFHDENLLLPRPADSLSRMAAIKRVLDEQGVARAALVGKCRPDTLTPALARELARLGVIRMYVGIENASESGALHLNRQTDVATMGAALDACADAGIFACYNLLIFEPETVLDDIATNLAFMRAHASTPVNFCRAEPYVGTPLYRRLSNAGKLRGGFLGCDYRIDDDRAELLFRISASAFRERNFAADGVANRYMGIGYSAKLLEFFYPDARGRHAMLMERAQELTRSITLDTADLLEQAHDIAARADLAEHERLTRQTAMLGLRVAASDRVWHAALDALERDMLSFARGESQTVRRTTGRVAQVAQNAAVAGWLALWATGCGKSSLPAQDRDAAAFDTKKSDSPVLDPAPRDSAAQPDQSLTKYDLPPVIDPVPRDARPNTEVHWDSQPDARPGIDIASPRDGADARGIDGTVLDTGRADTADGPMIVDPPPRPTDARNDGPMIVDPLPPAIEPRDAPADLPPYSVDPVVEARPGLWVPPANQAEPRQVSRAHWALTMPMRLPRSQDLPLSLCPDASLAGEWQGDKVRVRLSGVPSDLSTRWQAQGQVEGEGAEVLWTPSSDEDQLDVAVRTNDGVAITLLRLDQVRGRKA